MMEASCRRHYDRSIIFYFRWRDGGILGWIARLELWEPVGMLPGSGQVAGEDTGVEQREKKGFSQRRQTVSQELRVDAVWAWGPSPLRSPQRSFQFGHGDPRGGCVGRGA